MNPVETMPNASGAQTSGGNRQPEQALAGQAAGADMEEQLRALIRQEITRALSSSVRAEGAAGGANAGGDGRQNPQTMDGTAAGGGTVAGGGTSAGGDSASGRASAGGGSRDTSSAGRTQGGATSHKLRLGSAALRRQERQIHERLASNLQRLKAVLHETQSIAKQMEELAMATVGPGSSKDGNQNGSGQGRNE